MLQEFEPGEGSNAGMHDERFARLQLMSAGSSLVDMIGDLRSHLNPASGRSLSVRRRYLSAFSSGACYG